MNGYIDRLSGTPTPSGHSLQKSFTGTRRQATRSCCCTGFLWCWTIIQISWTARSSQELAAGPFLPKTCAARILLLSFSALDSLTRIPHRVDFRSMQVLVLHQQASFVQWQQEHISYNFDSGKGEVGVEFFKGGQTNVCFNALDRHVKQGKGRQPCFLWEGNEPGESLSLTYEQVLQETCRVVWLLISFPHDHITDIPGQPLISAFSCDPSQLTQQAWLYAFSNLNDVKELSSYAQ